MGGDGFNGFGRRRRQVYRLICNAEFAAVVTPQETTVGWPHSKDG
jgi:hypothetical protein